MPEPGLTVSAQTAWCECKTCSTTDKTGKNLGIVEPLEGAWPNKPWVLTTFQVLHGKTNTINMKAELQFVHRLMNDGL